MVRRSKKAAWGPGPKGCVDNVCKKKLRGAPANGCL